jgi:hypothetical protein
MFMMNSMSKSSQVNKAYRNKIVMDTLKVCSIVVGLKITAVLLNG